MMFSKVLHVNKTGRLDFQPFCAPAFLRAHHGRCWEEDLKTGLPQTAENRAYKTGN